MAQQVIARLTPLGDSSQYQLGGARILNRNLLDLGFWGNERVVSTELTQSLGALFHFLFFKNIILINIGFQAIAFAGIVIFLRAVPPHLRVWLAALLMFPSFSIWSSVAGKEAIIVYLVGTLAALVMRMFRGPTRIRPMEFLAAILIYFFKIQYMPALVFIIAGTWIAGHVRQKTFVIMLGSVVSLVPLYFLRNTLDTMAFGIIPHFSGVGRTTRPPFWVEKFDVFWKAPEGMYQAFFGPTLAESSFGILTFASFAESALMLLILSTVLIWHLPKVPAAMLVMAGTTIFWVLFANYPLGIQNPGSAIRYRTGYEIIIFLAIFALLSRDSYSVWRRSRTNTDGESQNPVPETEPRDQEKTARENVISPSP
ncbi:MAG TPA: hypothetical protein EYQ81_08460 [Sneathiellales bacterium]|nr:hypothetical protein [Sneathiellales bacterium]